MFDPALTTPSTRYMTRRSPWLFGAAVVAALVALHLWFNPGPAAADVEEVTTDGHLTLLTNRPFHHSGRTFAVVHAYLEFPHGFADFTASADEAARVEALKGRRVRIVATRHGGSHGRFVSIAEIDGPLVPSGWTGPRP